MLIAIVPVLLMVVGALMYSLCANSKLAEIGRLMFAAGVFAAAFAYSGKTIALGG